MSSKSLKATSSSDAKKTTATASKANNASTAVNVSSVNFTSVEDNDGEDYWQHARDGSAVVYKSFGSNKPLGYVPAVSNDLETDVALVKHMKLAGIKPVQEHLPNVEFGKSAVKRILTLNSESVTLRNVAINGYKPFIKELDEQRTGAIFRDRTKWGVSGMPQKLGEPAGNLNRVLLLDVRVASAHNTFPFPVGVRLQALCPEGKEWRDLVPHEDVSDLTLSDTMTDAPKFIAILNPNESTPRFDKAIYTNAKAKDGDLSKASETRWWAATAAQIMKSVTPIGEEYLGLHRDGLVASAAATNEKFLPYGFGFNAVHSPTLPDGKTPNPNYVPTGCRGDQTNLANLKELEKKYLYVPTDKGMKLINQMLSVTNSTQLANLSQLRYQVYPLVEDRSVTAESWCAEFADEDPAGLRAAELNKRRCVRVSVEIQYVML
jgi:hypothetical protein